MEINDFHQQFYETTICHYHSNYQHLEIADTHDMDGHGLCRIDVDVDITGEGVTFSLIQMHKRYDVNWPE